MSEDPAIHREIPNTTPSGPGVVEPPPASGMITAEMLQRALLATQQHMETLGQNTQGRFEISLRPIENSNIIDFLSNRIIFQGNDMIGNLHSAKF